MILTREARAYISMLMIPPTSEVRHVATVQSALAHLRDYCADYEDRDPEDVQNEAEQLAALFAGWEQKSEVSLPKSLNESEGRAK